MTTTTGPAPRYPVRVSAALDQPLSRWLWLVKWILAIPHYIVLAFLWIAFVLLSIVAFFAILFTGRYPRAIFDFNVGVLRWTWRVQYYTYGALATDRYPPFSLAEKADYPARLDVAYPQQLSRGLVLVMWWLLAIPHYLIVGLFVGGGSWLAVQAGTDNTNWGGAGLIGLLTIIAGVVLAITGRYPQSIFDFVLGMNRWVLRVAAYAGLMTDRYPPFRLDMGGDDPGGTTGTTLTVPAAPSTGTAEPPAGAPEQATGGVRPPTAPGQPTPGQAKSWTAGRIIALVAGTILVLASFGLFAGGGLALWAHQNRDGGYVTSDVHSYATAGYAVTSDRVHLGDPAWTWQSDILGKVQVRAHAVSGQQPLFLGVGPSSEVDRYLAGVSYAKVNDFGHHHEFATRAGGPPAAMPTAQQFWTASSVGAGEQVLQWRPQAGDWTIVVMNANAGPGLNIEADAGATVPALPWIATGLLVGGAILLIAGTIFIVIPLRHVA
jgi:hypothetical protein